jgi:hypothetical protein
VKKGALLVTLDASEVRAQLHRRKPGSSMRSGSSAPRICARRTCISAQALEEARFENHSRAQASQREVQAKLAKGRYRAPLYRGAPASTGEPGRYVAAGTDIRAAGERSTS